MKLNRKPLPKTQGRLKVRTAALCGIDRRYGAPFGSVFKGMGAVCTDGKTLHGAPAWEKVYTVPDTLYPQSLTAVDGGLFSMCRLLGKFGDAYIQDENMHLVVYKEDGRVYTSLPVAARWENEEIPLASDINAPRSMVQFNVYSGEGKLLNALGEAYDKKLLIFPDKMSVDLPVNTDGFRVKHMEEERGDVPNLNYVTVQGGRLFGVDGGRIYASAYNDPWDWQVDTPLDIGAENAWVTATGADTRGDGDFRGVCAYDGKVWAMKEDFGHIVCGESNPFTVKDTDAIGAIDARGIARGDGRLFFIRSDGVWMAEGSSAAVISDPLCINRFTTGICTYSNGVLYVAEGESLYLYHVKSGSWSAIPLPEHGTLVSLVAGGQGVYALTSANIWDSCIHRLGGSVGNWGAEFAPVDFYTDTNVGPATFTLQGVLGEGASLSATLTDCATGRCTPLGGVTGTGGGFRLRKFVGLRGGHRYIVGVSVTGEATLHGMTLTARDGVKDDG